MEPEQAFWRVETFEEAREAARRTLRKQPRDEAMPKHECAKCGGFLGRYYNLPTDAGPVPLPPAILGGPLWPPNGSSVRLECFQPPGGKPRYHIRVQCSRCKRNEKVALADYAPPLI